MKTVERIDQRSTEIINGYKVRPGKPLPFGASLIQNGINFSIYSSAGTSCTLVLFEKGQDLPLVEILIPENYKIGDVYSLIVFDINSEEIEYGYRIDGPNNPTAGHRFNKAEILMDPYARLISGRDEWGKKPNWERPYPYRARVPFDESSGVTHPGTYAGLVEKIPYLKQLGVNAVELMPIFEFDEFENSRIHPNTNEQLYNYWGYSTLGFFAPKAAFASTGKFGMQVDEFKQLVKSLHAAGIEVILDVVFNHTAEGNENGPTLSFKGLDNKTYYMLTPEGYYFNFRAPRKIDGALDRGSV
jgi:isoamylase